MSRLSVSLSHDPAKWIYVCTPHTTHDTRRFLDLLPFALPLKCRSPFARFRFNTPSPICCAVLYITAASFSCCFEFHLSLRVISRIDLANHSTHNVGRPCSLAGRPLGRRSYARGALLNVRIITSLHAQESMTCAHFNEARRS